MKPIEHAYFVWLVSQIDIPNDKSYNQLFSRMYDLEFIWTIPHDDDRANDGRDLRYEFSERIQKMLKTKGVSILEVLIGLSRRTAFTGGGDARVWAWRLIKNLGLNKMFDPLDNGKATQVENILEDLVWRNYEPNGRGGFFPLKNAEEDQTKIDVWYQMNAYVIERGAH